MFIFIAFDKLKLKTLMVCLIRAYDKLKHKTFMVRLVRGNEWEWRGMMIACRRGIEKLVRVGFDFHNNEF